MEFSCKYCGSILKNQRSFGAHSKICKPYKDLVSSITREVLYEMYHIKGMSCLDIQDHFGFHSFSKVYHLMDKLGIDRRTLSESSQSCSQKRQKTNLERYGSTHNFNKSHPSRSRWEKRLLDEEGITNVFQRESVKRKSTETLLERYGVEDPWKLDTVRGNRSFSSIHRDVITVCNNLSIDVDIELKLKKDSGIGYYAYDIVINNSKKIIEVYGDYWHGNPSKYKDTDILLRGSSREMTVLHKREFDRNKNEYAVSKGYSVLIIWESSLKDNIELVRDLILDYSVRQISPSISSSTLL